MYTYVYPVLINLITYSRYKEIYVCHVYECLCIRKPRSMKLYTSITYEYIYVVGLESMMFFLKNIFTIRVNQFNFLFKYWFFYENLVLKRYSACNILYYILTVNVF